MFFISKFVDKKIENYYFFDEYEDAQHLMSFSKLKNAYDKFENFLKIINEFIKNHDYAINIRNFNKIKKSIKNVVYFCCNKKQKMKFNKKRERRKIEFKRIECFFQIVDKLIDNK